MKRGQEDWEEEEEDEFEMEEEGDDEEYVEGGAAPVRSTRPQRKRTVRVKRQPKKKKQAASGYDERAEEQGMLGDLMDAVSSSFQGDDRRSFVDSKVLQQVMTEVCKSEGLRLGRGATQLMGLALEQRMSGLLDSLAQAGYAASDPGREVRKLRVVTTEQPQAELAKLEQKHRKAEKAKSKELEEVMLKQAEQKGEEYVSNHALASQQAAIQKERLEAVNAAALKAAGGRSRRKSGVQSKKKKRKARTSYVPRKENHTVGIKETMHVLEEDPFMRRDHLLTTLKAGFLGRGKLDEARVSLN